MLLILRIIFTSILLSILSNPAAAQTAVRTNVSSHGVDSGVCSVASPCRTFAYAFSQTLAGGEIDVVDVGTYGPVNITRNVSIISNNGAGGINVTSGNVGIYVNGSGINVSLIGLSINGGISSNGSEGIYILNADRVTIQDCIIQGNLYGIHLYQATNIVTILGNKIFGNGTGINAYGVASGTRVLIGNNNINGNGNGLYYGSYLTYGDNSINGNLTDTYSASTTIIKRQ